MNLKVNNMKKILTVLILSFALMSAKAQAIAEGQAAIVYSLPKTELVFDVVLEKTTQTPGMYYQYAERYLAADKIILENKTTYNLKSITLKTKELPDQSRTYVVTPEKNSALNKISVNQFGLLCGVNVPVPERKAPKEQKDSDVSNTKSVLPDLLPLGEEYMMAGSTAKLAEGAAKQIYRIRESRLSILTGDMDHMPSDGTALSTMLAGLDNMEKNLTELFVGKTTVETLSYTIAITPDKALDKEILFRLSAFKGVVGKEDLSGKPYYVTVTPETTTNNGNQKTKVKETLNTVLPVATTVSLSDGVNTIYSDRIPMPQFGITVPVSDIILSNQNVKIYVDAATGRLLRVE